MRFYLLIVIFLGSIGAAGKTKVVVKDWATEAVRMTGESDQVRERALRRLRKIPDLEATLKKELNGSKKALALDVISALEMRALLPDLLSTALTDETGFVYLTLNNLMTSKNRGELVPFYKKQLLCRFLCATSGPSQVVILETLARLNEEIEVDELEKLFAKTSWPEVQGAIIDYSRYMVTKFKKEKYAVLLKKGLESETVQLQQQTLAVISEIPKKKREKIFAGIAIPAEVTLEKPQDVGVRISFGYKDARPARFVGDRYERLYLLQRLLKPCESGEDLACGFERDKRDLNLFTKTVSTENKEKILIRLNITASAASPDDEDNRKNPYQKHLSETALDNFLEGVQSAEAVFYVGHSRDGGGPDFKPPRLTKEHHVAYAWYRKHEPGLNLMLEHLKTDEKKERSPFKLGLLSCVSTQLFEKKIRQATDKVTPVTVPKLIYYSEALEILLKELSDFIHLKINDYAPKS